MHGDERFFLSSALASLKLAVILCAASHSAAALEYFPEFESLTEEEEGAFEGPDRLGAEYQSNVLTYMKPVTWEYEWLAHPKALDFSIGSLDASHFLMDSRLKVHAPLNDMLEFRFTYFDDRDFEKESVHHMIELVAWPKKEIGLSLYGEADFFKRRDDTGISVLLRPHPRHEIRLFNTFVDVTLLKRSDRSDTFLIPDLPYSRGIVGRIWSDPEGGRREFAEYAFRQDTKTRWYFPDQEYIYEYHKTDASFFFSKALNPALRIDSRLHYDHKFEKRERASVASSTVPREWTTDRFTAFARGVIPGIGPAGDWELTLGLMTAYRWWKTEIGTAKYRDLLPHLSLSLPGFASGGGQDRWSLGVMATVHRSEGPSALFTSGEARAATEYRLNICYEFVFKDKAVIRLIATGDLDEYGTPRSWEGGNGQFSLFF